MSDEKVPYLYDLLRKFSTNTNLNLRLHGAFYQLLSDDEILFVRLRDWSGEVTSDVIKGDLTSLMLEAIEATYREGVIKRAYGLLFVSPGVKSLAQQLAMIYCDHVALLCLDRRNKTGYCLNRTSCKLINDFYKWLLGQGMKISLIEGSQRVPSLLREHDMIKEYLRELGELLGFVSETEYETPGGAYRIDVIWTDLKGHAPRKAFEVESSGDVDRALARLMEAYDKWNTPELYLVIDDETDLRRIERLIDKPLRGAFARIRDRVKVLTIEDLSLIHECLLPVKDRIKMLAKKP